MPSLEAYIFEVGIHTSNTMRFILHDLLSRRYKESHDPEFAGKLAAEVANYVFDGAYAVRKTSDFARENSDIIEASARNLSGEDAFYQALTCAVYNFSYAKYVEAGRKIGFLFHPFLAYVRALQRKELDVTARLSESNKVPPEASLPLLHLSLLKLMRPLPWTPDSKLMLDAVVSFGRAVGSSVS